MTKTFKVLALALCLLLAWTANCAAYGYDDDMGGGPTDLPAKKMEYTPASGKERAYWSADWSGEDWVYVSCTPLDADTPAKAGKLDLFLSEAGGRRAYEATFDRKTKTLQLTYAQNFQSPNAIEEVKVGKAVMKLSNAYGAEGEDPMYGCSFDRHGIAMSYAVKGSTLSMRLFDNQTNKAFFIDYDLKKGTVGGYVIQNLGGAG